MALTVDSATVIAGGRKILNGISFQLHPGELCALIGPSGAGKSTLIKVLLGLRRTSDGTAQLNGLPVAQSEVPIGYVPQYDALHETLSPRQSLYYSARLRLPQLSNDQIHQEIEILGEEMGIADRLDLNIKRLSGGQKKRVSVAMELLTSPPVLILDEPTSGLDPGMEVKMTRLFANLAQRGRVLMVATHAMESINLCDQLIVLMEGQLLYFGPPKDSLDYFRAKSYAEIFQQLPKRSAKAWGNAWLKTAERSKSLKRPAPALGNARKTPPQVAEQSTSSKSQTPGLPREVSPKEIPAQPAISGAQAKLAALKNARAKAKEPTS